MARLQRQKSYRYKRKEHYKHVVVIPEKLIEELGWSPGQELSFSADDSGIIISTNDTNMEVE